MTGNDKIKDPFIKDYREHNDDTTVHFEVIMSEENLIMAKQEGLLKKFKLTTTISTSNMHLFDPKVLEEFFHESEVICQT
ncbi:DNA topoisomerase 2-like isoform X2 [Camellia sinensis]|uniref:DNA topoisomerase 2-like isoform X2 n=1 Tax=Camellia sinensis TaxID=4442 RepID=UPI0010362484|nr:DNA topoisomerase 2-like isoform X2 [Camellia sinensis]